jgi:hypothetical protein
MKIGHHSAQMKVVDVYRTEARVPDEIGLKTILAHPFLDLGPWPLDISGGTEIWGSWSRSQQLKLHT